MSVTYEWSFAPQVSQTPINGLDKVVLSFSVSVRANDGETQGHNAWRSGVDFAPAAIEHTLDPASFVAFPASAQDTPAFEATLKAWALAHLNTTEAAIDAAALALLNAHKAGAVAQPLP